MAGLFSGARRLISSLSGKDNGDLKRQGNALLAEGRLQDALACYQQAASLCPEDASAHLNLGFALLELGEAPRAEESLGSAVAHDPSLIDGWYLLGRALALQGRNGDAEAAFRRALSMKPEFEFALRDLAQLLAQGGQQEEALQCHQRALAADPTFADSLAEGSKLLMALERPVEALGWADRLVAAQPQLAAAHLRRAEALHALGRREAAQASLDTAIGLSGADPAVWHLQGNFHFAASEYEAAASSYGRALQLFPQFVESMSNRAVCLHKLGRREDALALYRQALLLRPNYAPAVYNLGRLLLDLGRCEEALALCETGLRLNPGDADIHMNKADAHLLLGQLEAGWPEYEWRWEARGLGHRSQRPVLPSTLWTGQEPIAGASILLIPEQGLGDDIQFIRYAPLLAERGAKVIVQLPPALEPLLHDWVGVCSLVREGQPMPHVDFHCPLLSLPGAFRTTVDTIPARIPYLRSDPARKLLWEQQLGARRSGPRIGLVWSGNAAHNNDTNRSIALASLMAQAPAHCEWVSLQKDVRDADREALAAIPGLFHAGERLTSFADTAALVDCMDLVISVDTSVAHLVGALGKPLWLLLPFRPDWRWMMNREDSPWYPSARLFRQDERRDWKPVLERLMRELKERFPQQASR